MNVVPDELLQLPLAFDVKFTTHSRELVMTSLRHLQREGLNLGFIDQHRPPPVKLCI